jgi:hypothetical protein
MKGKWRVLRKGGLYNSYSKTLKANIVHEGRMR